MHAFDLLCAFMSYPTRLSLLQCCAETHQGRDFATLHLMCKFSIDFLRVMVILLLHSTQKNLRSDGCFYFILNDEVPDSAAFPSQTGVWLYLMLNSRNSAAPKWRLSIRRN